MAFDFNIDDNFLREFNRKLDSLDKKVKRKVVTKALNATGDVLKRELNSTIKSTFVSSKRSGKRALWSSKVREKRSNRDSLVNKSAIGKVRKNTKGFMFLNVTTKPQYFYARILEKGTDKHPLWRKRGSDNESKVGSLPPRPFFAPAYLRSRTKMENTFKDTFRREFHAAVKQIKR